MSLLEDSKHFRIPYEDIKEATKNFTNQIGSGGYGPVYRGQFPFTVVAVKQLNTSNLSGQGLKEFLTEIQMLSRYKHQNIVSFFGFCEERKEKFLIYEYAERGSLNNYLKLTNNRCPLTWKQRINICIDAARGLDYLHNHVAKNQRVIHRDIKSANILLDHNWKAMIADFGLSRLGRANESVTYVITNPCGTPGYCDPAYINSGILTKESDIYSFGVVLLEVVCGRLCFINVDGEGEDLVKLAKRYRVEQKFNLIIDCKLGNYMNSNSMKEFTKIAFQCLGDNRSLRPPMGVVLQKLEQSLKFLETDEAPELLEVKEAPELPKHVETLQIQEVKEALELLELEEALELPKLVETLQMQQFKEACEVHELEEELRLRELVKALEFEIGESRIDYEVIKALYDMPYTPLSNITRDEVYSKLSRGIFVDSGKVWFSIDGDGKTHEMISAMKFVSLDGKGCRRLSKPESRFGLVAEVFVPDYYMQLKIRTQFLSSNVTYTAYLVCKPMFWPPMEHYDCSLSCKLNDTCNSYISYRSKMEYNGWWMFELFQTINFKRTVDFEVTLQLLDKSFGSCYHVLIDGIKFVPVHEFDVGDEIENLEEKDLPLSDIECDNRLPSDYKQFLYYSNKKLMYKPHGDAHFPAKEEAYFILSRGVLIKVNNGVNIWFWITKLNGKKCFLLPPTLVSYDEKPMRKIKHIPSKESRIENVVHLSPSKVVGMCFKFPSGLLSKNTTYGCYLVYKMPQGLDCKTLVELKLDDDSVLPGQGNNNLTNLGIPQIPIIGADGVCRSTRPISNLKSIKFARKRKDGWLEVTVTNIQEDESSGYVQSREKKPWKSWVLPCFSHKESGVDNHTDYGFTLDPRYFLNVTVLMSSVDNASPMQELIVQGIEFRPL